MPKNINKVQARLQNKCRAQHRARDKTICLTMIVKNEAKNMVRCLNSCKPIIDMVSICDTGSTDNTIRVIEKWCSQNKIPGTVHRTEFGNFAAARTLSVKKAQATYPEADYLLLIDADMVLEPSKDFNKKLLFEDSYLMVQYNSSLSYLNYRLKSNKRSWRCYGVTHEYWDLDREIDPDGTISRGTLTTIKINDLGDGGSKDDKFERDERLLLAGLFDEAPIKPERVQKSLITRYTFYLAQTYKDTKQILSSFYWYLQRIQQQKINPRAYIDEVFFSYFYIADGLEQAYFAGNNPTWDIYKYFYNPECYSACITDSDPPFLPQVIETFTTREAIPKFTPSSDRLTDAERKKLQNWYYQYVTKYYLRAHKTLQDAGRPLRAEPLYRLAKFNRIIGRGKQEVGYRYAKLAQKIPRPNNDALFLQNNVYDYLIDYEISILAGHIPNGSAEGRETSLRLLNNPRLPTDLYRVVERNCKFYI